MSYLSTRFQQAHIIQQTEGAQASSSADTLTVENLRSILGNAMRVVSHKEGITGLRTSLTAWLKTPNPLNDEFVTAFKASISLLYNDLSGINNLVTNLYAKAPTSMMPFKDQLDAVKRAQLNAAQTLPAAPE